MKKILLVLIGVCCTLGGFSQDCGPFKFRSYNILDTAFTGSYGADTFQLSQDYPAELPAKPRGGFKWDRFNPRQNPEDFMNAVLDYCWEGMDSADFFGQYNPIRMWYHAPWLDYGYGGREFLHGLVMDRTSFPKDLHPKQNAKFRNYSITYYNPLGGYALGQVWCDPQKPDPTKASFPVGSVVFKLVFSLADTTQVVHLRKGMQWEILAEKNTNLPIDEKQVHVARLLAVDFAVKTDNKEAVNGWVFGTFAYNGRYKTDDIRKKLVPLGLQWGNDPGVKPEDVREGKKSLKQTWLNTNAWVQDDPDKSLLQKPGWGYRLMGPVGKTSTSAMAQAMTASWPPISPFPPSGTGIKVDSILHWHRNLRSGTPFAPGLTSLDYSLELRDGLRNHAIANGDEKLKAEYNAELAEALGFRPPDRTTKVEEKEVVVIEYDEGLEGRNLYVFIALIALFVVMGALLARNFLAKSE